MAKQLAQEAANLTR